ncbi:MAG: hypothetical protein ACRDD1_18070 [Planctomycetia bacterium]
MARPGFTQHPKFRRLVHLLDEPAPHCLGYVEYLWTTAYNTGDPVFRDAVDVELAAEFPGAKGALCAALVECRLLDARDDGGFEIHDFFEHVPEYVRNRRTKEIERRKVKTCAHCGGGFQSGELHAKFCSAACRSANHRRTVVTHVTQGCVTETEGCVTVTQRNALPSPPSPREEFKNKTPLYPPSDGGEHQRRDFSIPPSRAEERPESRAAAPCRPSEADSRTERRRDAATPPGACRRLRVGVVDLMRPEDAETMPLPSTLDSPALRVSIRKWREHPKLQRSPMARSTLVEILEGFAVYGRVAVEAATAAAAAWGYTSIKPEWQRGSGADERDRKRIEGRVPAPPGKYANVTSKYSSGIWQPPASGGA